MIVIEGTKPERKVSKEEVSKVIDEIFERVTTAIREKENTRVTLENVDKTLNALFDSIDMAVKEGKKANLPDFQKLMK